MTPIDFYRLPPEIAVRRDLTATDKLVFQILITRQGDNGHSWPGYGTIAKDCGISRSTVILAIRALAEKNLIVIKHGEGGKQGNSNRYEVRTGIKNEPVQNRDSTQSDIHTPTGPKFGPEKKRLKEKRKEKAHAAQIVFDPEHVTFTGIPDADLSRWATTYPGVDVQGELRKAAEWYLANPKRRKKDIRRFLTGWLGRSKPKIDPMDEEEARYAAMEATGKFDDFDRQAKIGNYAEVRE